MTQISRRHLLQSAGAFGAAAGMGILPRFGLGTAQAANVGGYRAIVCVFLKGGMDCHDTVLPYDQTSYDRYAEIRSELINTYSRSSSSRARTNLLELSPLNSADFGSRAFALSPDLAPLHTLFQNGRASIIGNTGPLLTPTNKTSFDDNRSSRPKKLFSHNDQQSTWMTLAPEGAKIGWGGRFADAAIESNANINSTFTSISVNAGDPFLTGTQTVQYQISDNGASTVDELTKMNLYGSARDNTIAHTTFEDHVRYAGDSRTNLFERDVMTVGRRSIDANAAFKSAFGSDTPLTTVFPDTRLARSLAAVAETIRIRDTLQANRQVFYVSMGGFDTHSGQSNTLPRLHQELSEALAAFYMATEEMGIASNVTTFTASDFGRTLITNGAGSDHGWAGHHFVIGGDINGGRIFGDMHPYDVDHEFDSGRGRFIPTTSIEQFAAPLGRWFGLTEGELATALPNLSSFGTAPDYI